MFTLHEYTRILLCRIAFLLLCVLPVCVMIGTIWHYRHPAYIAARKEEWIAVLADKLGLDLQVEKLTYPAWNTALLEHVSLHDPETGTPVLTTRYVEIIAHENKWQVIAGQPEIDANSLPLLQELVHTRLLKGRALKLAPCEFKAGEVTLRRGSEAQTFNRVLATLGNTENGKKVDLQFHVAGLELVHPIQIAVERDRSGEQVKTLALLTVGEQAVPAAQLRLAFPWLEALGEQATFQGTMHQEYSTQGWHISANGKFSHVNLERLIAEKMPHYKLTGLADIDLQTLEIHNGAIALLQGKLQSQSGGEISRGLLNALASQLDLAPKTPPALTPQPRVRYTQLAFNFKLDSSGLAIASDAPQKDSGVIMASVSAGNLLVESSQAVLPAVALIQALSPHSEHSLPATLEAKNWFDILPAPALLPEEETSIARPHWNLRLRREK